MKTDIEIAQETKMLPITTVASQYGITEDDLELYGKYKAKISNELWQEIKDRPDGKLVLVTAINPTPAERGKTTTSIGLARRWQNAERKQCLPSVNRPSDRALGSKAELRRRICPGCSDGGLKPSFYR